MIYFMSHSYLLYNVPFFDKYEAEGVMGQNEICPTVFSVNLPNQITKKICLDLSSHLGGWVYQHDGFECLL